jgi:hypothetical protein
MLVGGMLDGGSDQMMPCLEASFGGRRTATRPQARVS